MKVKKKTGYASTMVIGLAVLSRYWNNPRERTAGIIAILVMLALFMTVDNYFSDDQN